MQWNKQSANEEPKVIGGSLLQFTTLNFLKSKQHCENLLMQLMSNSNIQHEVSEALRNSQPLNIEIKVEEIIAQYKESAVGPAADESLDKGLSEIAQLGSVLKKIPGKPRDVWTSN